MDDRGIDDLDELNDYFMAWAEQVANTRAHAETHQAPIERFGAGHTLSIPPPGLLAEAFRWSVVRRVTKTATVNLFANRYGVDPALVGRTVELHFDPEDLTVIDVFDDGIDTGTATPFVIGRPIHPAVPQAAPAPVVDDGPGIDYMGLVASAHAESLGESSISYRDVRLPDSTTSTTTPPPAVTSRHAARWRRHRRSDLMAGLDVCAAHFGLTRTPFTKTIPAAELFDRAAHGEAVARIHYCINEAALGVIVGDTGAGKTVAVRAAVASLDRTKYTVVYLSNPSGGCRGLYVRHRHRARRNAPVPQGRSD